MHADVAPDSTQVVLLFGANHFPSLTRLSRVPVCLGHVTMSYDYLKTPLSKPCTVVT